MPRHNIKQIRPNSRYKSGAINPESCKKLFESQKHIPIIYRSSYEKAFIFWLENSSKVLHWGSECVGIPYTNLQDGTSHTYYPDYIVEYQNGDVVQVILIEIKPYNQTQPPRAELPKDSYAWREYARNISKWKAAKSFCESHNMIFKILTERTISRL
jgi:hypothetical protein